MILKGNLTIAVPSTMTRAGISCGYLEDKSMVHSQDSTDILTSHSHTYFMINENTLCIDLFRTTLFKS